MKQEANAVAIPVNLRHLRVSAVVAVNDFRRHPNCADDNQNWWFRVDRRRFLAENSL
jgi:hypothetical protein